MTTVWARPADDTTLRYLTPAANDSLGRLLVELDEQHARLWALHWEAEDGIAWANVIDQTTGLSVDLRRVACGGGCRCAAEVRLNGGPPYALDTTDVEQVRAGAAPLTNQTLVRVTEQPQACFDGVCDHDGHPVNHTLENVSPDDLQAADAFLTRMERPVCKQSEQNLDGTPHLTFYDSAHHLSFVWDLHTQHIDVCEGGYGEPVVDSIPLGAEFFVRQTPMDLAYRFQITCQAFVRSVWEPEFEGQTA